MDVGPLITKWGQTLVWVSGVRDIHKNVVYQIHVYDVESGAARIVATSRPGFRFINAYRSGDVLCFLRQTGQATDVWVTDLRTGRFRQLTHTGKTTDAVVTGPWVAWHVLGSNALGPVIVEDLRTGRQWTVTRHASYQLSASNGLLAWDNYRRDRWNVLDLMTGRSWTPSRLSSAQAGGTLMHLQGDVVVESALTPGATLGRIQVYRHRRLPVAPRF
jgi:hypothetical protein